ncbi:unnamed protein product [Fraxinus pennsylvanica]|uniref:ATG8-interacting protein 1 n=1 Tax=Fraxinus pennsylvanica TaxID=56036 RepID=A0AAD1YYE5_9LAMI|nr:unnamed protein product [Fraxinus pennsylvanica]
MADNEDRTETAPKGNEWEVVSLTESAYAAAPGPKQVDSSEDSQGNSVGESEAETSRAMFMSGHFLFTQSQHENLPLEPVHDEIRNEKGDEGDLPYLIAEEKGKLDVKDEEKMSIEELTSDEFPGVQDFDEKDNRLSVGGADLQKDMDREQFISGSAEFSAFHNISNMGRSYTVEEDAMTDDMAEPFEHALNSSSSSFQKPVEENKYDGADLPCEAWWKRQALSLYVHAKEANTFWSIIIATAVAGLVIIGHKWQQERWQVLQLRRQFSINDEKMGRILGPISRFLKM